MTEFVDLDRRFHPLTDGKIDDAEILANLGDSDFDFNKSWANLIKYPRVVLLAEAGAGKTFEMQHKVQQLVYEGNYAFFLPLEALDQDDIRDILTPDEEDRFNSWMAEPDALAWFFLDSVDELKLRKRTLDRALRRLSKSIGNGLNRARFVISCRQSDWRQADESTVRKRLPLSEKEKTRAVRSRSSDEAFSAPLRREHPAATAAADESADAANRDLPRIFVMLPLSDKRIKRFATRIGVDDVSAFLAELERRNAWSFARRPQDLGWLARSWRTSGRLATWERLHHENIDAKLTGSPDRPDAGILAERRAARGAERLALALTLTRTGTIRSPDGALDIQRSDHALDPARILNDWTPKERQALLRRALFDPATYGRVRFHHHSIQEYLAARRLRNLRKKGMTTKALCRLLFDERHESKVVLPSMRAIAAWLALWNDAVRNELIEREPEALLSHGDPGSLDVGVRCRIVRKFVELYGKGGYRGLNIPIASIRRLVSPELAAASPELAATIRECWRLGQSNDDVRKSLLEMIWQGQIVECADLAWSVAAGETAIPFHRIIAVRALVACKCDADLRVLTKKLMECPKAWIDGVVHGVAVDLFPCILTTDQLIALMKRTPGPQNTVREFEWTACQIARNPLLKSKYITELRDKITRLIQSGCNKIRNLNIISSKFDYLVPVLATLCMRQLSDISRTPDPELIRSCVVASRFGQVISNHYVDHRPSAKLRSLFQDPPLLRECAFWAELDFVDGIGLYENHALRHRHASSEESLTGCLEGVDRPWLMNALADNVDLEKRTVALHALLDLWHRDRRVEPELDSIREKLNGDSTLSQILAERTTLIGENEKKKERRRKRQVHEAVREKEEQDRLDKREKWRKELISSPDEHFTTDRWMQTVHNIYRWLNYRDNVMWMLAAWDREALITGFNLDIAERVAKALHAHWRATPPATWATRQDSEKNNIPYDAILGLMGVSAEAETPEWEARLSPDETERAAAYATLELNEFAHFLTDLTKDRSDAVEKAIGGELSAQLRASGSHDHLPGLSQLGSADSALKKLLAPRLFKEIGSWPFAFAESEEANWAGHLDSILRILDESGDAVDRSAAVRECACRYRRNPGGQVALSWLRGLARFDAVKATEALVATLIDPDDAASRKRAAEIFGTLFDSRDPVAFMAKNPGCRANIFKELVRLAHAFIRPEEDQTHDEVYTPNARDHAQRARDTLLAQLCDIPGPETCAALISLADERCFASGADHLKMLARRRAAEDAEPKKPYTARAVVALERNYEIPPNDEDGTFYLAMDRLQDPARPGKPPPDLAAESRMRVELGLLALRDGLEPYVEKHMCKHFDVDWRQSVNQAVRNSLRGDPLDVYALLKVMIHYWKEVFQRDGLARHVQTLVSVCFDARNDSAHYSGKMEGRHAERYLDAMRDVLGAIGATEYEDKIKEIYKKQRVANERQGRIE